MNNLAAVLLYRYEIKNASTRQKSRRMLALSTREQLWNGRIGRRERWRLSWRFGGRLGRRISGRLGWCVSGRVSLCRRGGVCGGRRG